MRETLAPFWGHVEELRRLLLRLFMIICIGTLCAFFCYDRVIPFLTSPFRSLYTKNLVEEKLEQVRIVNRNEVSERYSLPNDVLISSIQAQNALEIASHTYQILPGGSLIYTKSAGTQLMILSPLEGFCTALRVSFWIGAVGTSPIWLWAIFQFILPALHRHEKRLIFPFLFVSIAFILAGFLFAFFVTIPFANAYLLAFNQPIGSNLWSLDNYLNYTLLLLLANGLAFELCVLGIFAIELGFISTQSLALRRRHAIVGAFILGAILTPPDVLTQFLLAIPLIFLYEGIILYSRVHTYRINAD